MIDKLRKIKIIFLGNMNNLSYTFSKEIDKDMYDVKLLIDQTSDYYLDRPERIDSKMIYPYPSWIEELPKLGNQNFFLLRAPKLFFRALIKKLNKYDIVILNGNWIALAKYINKDIRVVEIFGGYDLDVLGDLDSIKTLCNNQLKKRPYLKILKPFLMLLFKHIVTQQRDGIKRANAVNYFPSGINEKGDNIINEIKKGQKYTRLEIRGMSTDEYPFIDNRPVNTKFKILNFTRFLYLDNSKADNKRNDIMIEGIAEFIKNNNILPEDILIEFYEKGEDLDAAKSLLKDLNIINFITWKKGVDQTQLNYDIQTSDVLFDQLGNQWIGYGVVAFLYGIPVIANGRPEIFESITEEIPVLCQATTVEEVSCWLKKLYFDRNLGIEIGKKSNRYYRKHFDIKNTISFILDQKQ